MAHEQESPAELEAFVEKMGEYFVSIGSTRIAGRIVGWLLVCEPSHQSAEDLARATGASKGSVSNVLKLCLAGGLIERIGLPGERRAYYQIRPEAWSDMFVARMAKMAELRRIADEGLKMLEGLSVDRTARLRAMRDLYAFYEAQIPTMLELWKARQKK